MKKKIRILVADDHAVVRMGLVTLIDSETDFEVVAQAGNGEQTIKSVHATHPDVVLLDLVMPGMDGAKVIQTVKNECPETRILVLTSFSTTADISRALNAGADGLLLKSSDYSDVAKGIRTIFAGGTSIAPEVQKMISVTPPVPGLTQRQLEILESLCRGLTNADIARQLNISADGVKFHITSILAKLGAANRAEAISIALREHLLV